MFLFQFRYPLCLVLLSNNRGLFEVLNSCRPYVLFAICDVTTETTLRVLTLDCAWMLRMSDMVRKMHSFLRCFTRDLLKQGWLWPHFEIRHPLTMPCMPWLFQTRAISSIHVVFLRNRLYLRCAVVTSFWVHFWKLRRGLLREAKRSEGEWVTLVKGKGA